MTEPLDPQYAPPPPGGYPPPPPPGYGGPGGPGGYPPSPPPPRGPGIADRIGPRAFRRPDPRLGVTLAGIGVGLAIFGVILWSGDYLSGGIHFDESGSSSDGGSRKLLGIALSLAVVAVGYVLAIVQRRGPLATAGVVASALGVPVLFAFITFDLMEASDSGLPFSFDAVVIVSVVVWLLSYLFVPGMRGHAFYLALSATLLWIYVLDKAEPHTFSPASWFSPVLRSFGADTNAHSPDLSTIAAISFTFGLVYYVVMVWLDRTGRPGAGVGFAVPAFLATVAGIIAAAPDLEQTGTGIVLVVLGAVLSWVGAQSVRRFTTWVWGLALGIGVATLVEKATTDNAAAGGITLIVCGAIVVAAGWFLAGALGEPPDDEPTVAANAAGSALH